MYEQIVIGCDGSDGARDALALARGLREVAAAATAVCVHGPPRAEGSRSRSDLPTPDEARAALAGVRGEAAWLERRAVAAAGAAAGLEAVARERPRSLLVVGSSRHGPVGRVHPGVVGRRLLERAPCAIAMPPRAYPARAGGMRSVLFVFDGAHQLPAVADAAALAGCVGAALHIVCVVPQLARWARTAGAHLGYSWSSVARHHRDHYADLLDQAAAAAEPVLASTLLLEGPTANDDLVDRTLAMDLVLLGPPATGALQRLLAGVTSGTLCSAHCPVVVSVDPAGRREAAPAGASVPAGRPRRGAAPAC